MMVSDRGHPAGFREVTMGKRMWPTLRCVVLVLASAWGVSGTVVFPAVQAQEQEENQPRNEPPESDLDLLMAKALQRREVDRDRLRNYVFRERESLELKALDATPWESIRREYVWLVREGYLVRSPVRVNGVAVSREEQAKAEQQWIEQQKKRKKSGSLERQSFFGFRFQPGRYLLAGRQMHEGREVLVIEHYPKVSDEDKKRDDDKKRKDPKEEYYDEMFEKSLLVTMLVDPEESQIVRITFDNVGLDFLPGRWLARISELKASMDMHKAFDQIWLPRAISAGGAVVTANGTFELRYSRDFFDYQETDVRVKFWYEESRPERREN
jgi:hypothetical protein